MYTMVDLPRIFRVRHDDVKLQWEQIVSLSYKEAEDEKNMTFQEFFEECNELEVVKMFPAIFSAGFLAISTEHTRQRT